MSCGCSRTSVIIRCVEPINRDRGRGGSPARRRDTARPTPILPSAPVTFSMIMGCPSDYVGGAAGSEWHNHRDRACRIGLRPCDPRDSRDSGSARCQMQKLSSRKFHGVSPWRHQSYPNSHASERDRDGGSWPGAGAAPVSRGVRSLGSTCRRGNVADRRGPRHALAASAIEASSAVAATKLGGRV
jgi:hypothetical protein